MEENNTTFAYSGEYDGKNVKNTKKSSKGFWIATALLLVAVIALSVAVPCVLESKGIVDFDDFLPHWQSVGPEKETEAPTQPPSQENNILPVGPSAEEQPDTGKLTITQIAEKVNPSVVDITCTTSTGTSTAVGMIYTADGYIVTCAHVIDNAVSAQVILYPSGDTYDATIVGFDTYTEIGVLKIEATGLTPVTFADPASVKVGQKVVAIGSPCGLELTHSVSEGIVSGLRDDLKFESLGLILNVIQHSASINFGNSGGPLLNEYGQVIGMNSIKASSDTYDNIGFAVRVESIIDMADKLITNGSAGRPVIGIKGATDTAVGGIYVAQVIPGYGAEAAGIQVGDIITKLNGERVDSIEKFILLLGGYSEADEIELMILRDVESLTVKVKLMK